MTNKTNSSKQERLAFIENDLIENKLIYEHEKKYIKDIVRWIEFIDFICYKISGEYCLHMGDDNGRLWGDFFTKERAIEDDNYEFKLRLYMKIIKEFDKYNVMQRFKFPKELKHIDYWDNEYIDKDLEFYKDMGIHIIDRLIKFVDIFYKLNAFYARFINPITCMLRYSQISDDKYKIILEGFDEVILELVDLALYDESEYIMQEDEDELLYGIKEKIYWVKSIAYMYRIPIATELMKLVDEDHDDLYNELDEIEDKKYNGSPNYNDRQ